MLRKLVLLLAAVTALIVTAAAGATPTPVPGPLCTLGAPNPGGQTTLTLSGMNAVANVQWSFCGTTTSAVIHWTGAVTQTTNGTSGQVTLTAGQCESISADIYSGLDGYWTTQTAGPVCASTGGGGGGGGTSSDTDGDGVANTTDNCPTVANGPLKNATGLPSQNDADHNGVGDACQTTFPATNAMQESSSIGNSFPYCGQINVDPRCLSSAAGATKCATVQDHIWYLEYGTNRTVFHDSVALTPCWVPGGYFTGVKGTPSVTDDTCGWICTYPYRTQSHSGPGINYPNGQTMVVTVQWDEGTCVIFFGLTCIDTYPKLVTTYRINGRDTPPFYTGTQTLYVWKQSSVWSKGI